MKFAGPPNEDSSLASPQPGLRAGPAVALIVGIVIGAGIFRAPSVVADLVTHPGWMMGAWLLGGLVSAIGALCYAELATTYPHAGGDYHYLGRAYGRSLSFLFAWARFSVVTTGSIALLAFIFGDYLQLLLPLHGLRADTGSALYAAAAVLLLSWLNLRGLRAGTRAQSLLTVAEVGGLLLIFIAAATLPAAPSQAATTAAPSEAAFGLAMVFVLLSFGGWNEAAYISAELKNNGRSMCRVLLASLAVITTLYLMVIWAYWHGLGMQGMADSGARSSFAAGRDWPALRLLGRWQRERGTPANALRAQCAMALLLIAAGTQAGDGFRAMVEFTAPVFWGFFLLTGLSLFVLRHRDPALPRPFRVPLYPLTPLLFIATCTAMLWASLAHVSTQSIGGVNAAWVGVGVLLSGMPLLLWMRHAEAKLMNPRQRSP